MATADVLSVQQQVRMSVDVAISIEISTTGTCSGLLGFLAQFVPVRLIVR